MSRKALDYDQINENVKKAQYAVRGELYLRASELQKEGKKVRPVNIGYISILDPDKISVAKYRRYFPILQRFFDKNIGLI